MRNLKVIMAYRGTAYHGFQIQDNALTVQEVVERCVSTVLNEKVTINGCSRTDTGVHANNYCFSVETSSLIPPKNFVRGVNGLLPEDRNTFIKSITARVKILLQQILSITTDVPFTLKQSGERLSILSVLTILPAFAQTVMKKLTQLGQYIVLV